MDKKLTPPRQDVTRTADSPHLHPPPVEAAEAPAGEQLVAGEAHLFQDADGDLLAEAQPLGAVGAPVHPREAAAQLHDATMTSLTALAGGRIVLRLEGATVYRPESHELYEIEQLAQQKSLQRLLNS